MNHNKSSGISLDKIDMFSCEFKLHNGEAGLKYNLTITDMQRIFEENNTIMRFLISFNLMGEIENPLFKLNASFVSTYTRVKDANMTWEEFNNQVALAHIIPYLREFISNMTSRSPIPVLLLPPTNTKILIGDYEKRKKVTKASIRKVKTLAK